MLKDRIVDLVSKLNNLTKEGKIKWVEIDPSSTNRYYKRDMVFLAEDGTKYQMEIKFILKSDQSTWVLDEPGLSVFSKNLPDGTFYITNYRSDNWVDILRKTIYDNFCKDMNPVISDLENIFGNMTSGINKSLYRDELLKNILN